MANIETHLSKIASAQRGEEVRDSIVNALRAINNDVPVDMSNPEDLVYEPDVGSDYSQSYDPPKVMRSVLIKQPSSGGRTQNYAEIEIKENGTYPEDDPDPNYDPNDERRYYKKVVVNVPTLANKVIDLEDEITQNGTYSAFDFGADGLRSFKVNINPAPVTGQFEVNFYGPDKTTIINTQLVPAYGNAMCNLLDGDVQGGQYFKGWNPSPTNVTKDLNCYPVYGDIIINPGELTDSWDVICAKRGAGYPLLSTKPLSFSVIVQPETVLADCLVYPSNDPTKTTRLRIRTNSGAIQTICTVSCDMIKVAEGESGTSSTWISSGCINFEVNGGGSASQYGIVNASGEVESWTGGINIGNQGRNMLTCNRAEYIGNLSYSGTQDWSTCFMRSFLNGLFLAHLPEPIIQNVREVNKSFKGWSSLVASSASRVEKTSLDKIWIPSMKELHTLMSAYTAIETGTYPSSPLSDVEELNGTDYSVNYVPTWPAASAPGWWITRTMVSGNSNSISPLWDCVNSASGSYGSWSNTGDYAINYITHTPFGFCL